MKDAVLKRSWRGKTRGNLHPTMDGDTDGRLTLEHRTEPPPRKVQMRSRRRKKMKKEIRTARDANTH